jgi:hypothetical protein
MLATAILGKTGYMEDWFAENILKGKCIKSVFRAEQYARHIQHLAEMETIDAWIEQVRKVRKEMRSPQMRELKEMAKQRLEQDRALNRLTSWKWQYEYATKPPIELYRAKAREFGYSK